MKCLIRSAILLSLLFAFSSCSDDKKETGLLYDSLTFEKGSYEIRLNWNSSISIRSGNQHYTVEVEDESILSANTLILEESTSPGALQLLGKNKGETFVDITDNLINDKVRLKIKVVDKYLACKVTSNNEHPLFTANRYLYLVNNDERAYYIFSTNQSEDKLTLMVKGNYEPLLEDNTPFLLLTENMKGESKTYKFNLSDSDIASVLMLNSVFEFGWEFESKSLRAVSPTVYILNMKDQETDLAVSFMIDAVMEIPMEILD